jgi:hypothetical protein
MELNINGITIPFRSGSPASEANNSLYCANCEENYIVREVAHRNLCNVCGTVLKNSTKKFSPILETGVAQSYRWTSIVDFLGEDFRDLLDSAREMQAPERAITESSIQSLSRCTVDDSLAILNDCVLHMGPLQLMLIPAIFSKQFVEVCHSLELVVGQPEYGDAPLTNSEFVSGRVLLFKRGRVSFAQKYLNAIAAGASALIVVQTLDIWPFVMTDTVGELTGCTSQIPCYMLSKSDGQLLERLYPHAPISHEGGSRCAITISVFPRARECSICKDEFCKDEVVLKLLCRHVYHERCVSEWLRTKNSCPLCRSAPNPAQTSSNSKGSSLQLYA